MAGIQCDLTDEQMASVQAVAAARGLTTEQVAEMAVSAAIAARYRMRRTDGEVIPFQALNRLNRGPPSKG